MQRTPFRTMEPIAAPPHWTAVYSSHRSIEIRRARNMASETAGLMCPPAQQDERWVQSPVKTAMKPTLLNSARSNQQVQ